jgi:hypothetical protein
MQGYLVQGSFTENPKENVVHIPNPDPQLCQGVGRREKRGLGTTWMKQNLEL